MIGSPTPYDDPSAILARVSRWNALLAAVVGAVGVIAFLAGHSAGLAVLSGAVIGGLMTASGPYFYSARSRRTERRARKLRGEGSSSVPADSAGSGLAAYALRLAILAALLWGASRIPELNMRGVALTVLGLIVGALVVDAVVVLRARQL